MSSYSERAIDPVSGKIRPFNQVMEAELRAAKGAEIASSIARREAEAQKPETQKRLEAAKRALADAKFQGDKARIALWRDHVADLSEKLESEQAAQRKAETFAKDRRIALIREEAEAIARSGDVLYPHSSAIARETAVAIARSNDYPDPQSQYNDFREAMRPIEEENLAAERRKAGDAKEVALRHQVESLDAQVRISEIELAKVRREGVANA